MKSIKELQALRKVYIGGIGIVRFQRYDDQEYYDFGSQAILNCLDEIGRASCRERVSPSV
jgi:hypothetical protein